MQLQSIHEQEGRRLIRKNGRRLLYQLPQGGTGPNCRAATVSKTRFASANRLFCIAVGSAHVDFFQFVVLVLYDYLLVNNFKEMHNSYHLINPSGKAG